MSLYSSEHECRKHHVIGPSSLEVSPLALRILQREGNGVEGSLHHRVVGQLGRLVKQIRAVCPESSVERHDLQRLALHAANDVGLDDAAVENGDGMSSCLLNERLALKDDCFSWLDLSRLEGFADLTAGHAEAPGDLDRDVRLVLQ